MLLFWFAWPLLFPPLPMSQRIKPLVLLLILARGLEAATLLAPMLGWFPLLLGPLFIAPVGLAVFEDKGLLAAGGFVALRPEDADGALL